MNWLNNVRLGTFAVLVSLTTPSVVFAQTLGDQLGSLADSIPYGAVFLAVLLSVFGVVNAFVADDKIPGWLRPVWVILTSAYHKGANDPAVNGGTDTPPST